MKSRLLKIALFSVGWFLLVAGSGVGYFILYEKIKATGIATAKVQGETEFEVKKTERLRSLGNIVVETEKERTKLNSYFVARDDFVDFIVRLESIAKISGVESSLGGLATNSYPRGGEIGELLSLEISFSGTWSQDAHFIALLETMPYNLTLENLSLRYEGAGDKPTWNGRLRVTVVKLKN